MDDLGEEGDCDLTELNCFLYSFVFFMFGAGIWLLTAQPKDAEETEQQNPRRHALARKSADRATEAITKPAAEQLESQVELKSKYTRFPKKNVT